jgi:hypothetical protein
MLQAISIQNYRSIGKNNIMTVLGVGDMRKKEWAVYKGDEFQFFGTIKECAERLGMSESTVRFYSKPAHIKRSNPNTSIFLVDVGYKGEE